VRLDSLFIDEGFGILDPEPLETVADAIQSRSLACSGGGGASTTTTTTTTQQH
jgi:hypothetical protein